MINAEVIKTVSTNFNNQKSEVSMSANTKQLSISKRFYGWMAILVCVLSLGCADDPSNIVSPEPEPEYSPPDRKDVFWGPEIPKTLGEHSLRVKFNGEDRIVIVYVPAAQQAGVAAPLVLALHHGNGSAAGMAEDHPNLITAASEEGVVLAFPRGREEADKAGYTWWSFGNEEALADVAYLEGVIVWLQRYLPIDTKRTFMCGFSAGAGMTQRFAAERPNRIKAGAAFGYSTGFTRTDGIHVKYPKPEAPISMFLVRGGRDEAVPPDGMTPNDNGEIHDSVADQLGFWVNAAGGTPEQVVKEELDDDATRYTYASGSILVEMTYSKSLGHRWPTTYDRPVLDWFLALP
ncbi:MAG: alpha/beta hydrolase family esterase [bacterium]